jgi:hypothetical protein
MIRVRPVGAEAGAGEASGRHEPRHQLVGVERRVAVDQARRYSHSIVPGGLEVMS